MTIRISDKLIYFGAGCGIGLALGSLLLGTTKSHEVRRNSRGKASDLPGRVRGAGDQAKNVAPFVRQRPQQIRQAEKRRNNKPIDDTDLSER
jgi:hypothetical protein